MQTNQHRFTLHTPRSHPPAKSMVSTLFRKKTGLYPDAPRNHPPTKSMASALQEKIMNVEGVQDTLLCGIGAGARIIDSDLHPYGYGASRKEHSQWSNQGVLF